jgi:ATP-dependent exoDNAse (exonuclease V) alpha subunit
MELTKGQQEALDVIVKRYIEGEKYTVISGPAGSGKSTTIKYAIQKLVEECDLNPDDVCYATFTGKAAKVLQQKGNANVSTLHKLLYQAYPQEDGTFFFKPKDHLEHSFLVIDECGMLPDSMFKQIMNYPCHVLFLGDENQLPPIDKTSDSHLLDYPHVKLTEIMRQALDSDIIKVATDIRMGVKLKPYRGKDVQIFHASDLTTGMLEWADQIITATNKKRIELNNIVRELNGYSPNRLECGEKLICVKNEWDTLSFNEVPLINGTILETNRVEEYTRFVPRNIKGQGGKPYQIYRVYGDEDGDAFPALNVDKKYLFTGENTLDQQTLFKMRKLPKRMKVYPPKEFQFGYAISCHKAQGSEWDKVLIIEEKFPFSPDEHKKWLYTAVTRASKKAVIILKD